MLVDVRTQGVRRWICVYYICARQSVPCLATHALISLPLDLIVTTHSLCPG